NLDGSVTDGYVIGVDNALFGKVQLRRISNAGSNSPSISSNIALTVPTTYFPIDVPQTGTTAKLDALDDRLFNATIRNGHLWAVHNIGTSSTGVASTSSSRRDSARWYDITNLATSPSLNQSGTVFDSSSTKHHYWVPSITVSGQGHMAIGGSTSSTSNHPDAFTVGKLAGAALGTPTTYTASSFVYAPTSDPTAGKKRWGDYSFTSVDPNDDMTMWTINEYANATNSYAVQVAKLVAPPPATPSSASSSVLIGQSSTSVTVTGSSSSGSGFFDPGAGFANRIGASVSGGVVVNSVAYTDPTHVTLNLDTTGASAGSKNMTITNPDGQSRTGTGILTVTTNATTTTTAPTTTTIAPTTTTIP